MLRQIGNYTKGHEKIEITFCDIKLGLPKGIALRVYKRGRCDAIIHVEQSPGSAGVQMNQLIPVETIQSKIIIIRDEKALLDSDLAKLYGIETRVLKQQVRRNSGRFPEDFMFELTE